MRMAVITDYLAAVIKVRHVVEKFRCVLVERGECFCFVEFAIYLIIVRFCCSRILEVQIIIFK
jgi:CRISPR/Cas system-associated protein endoribonuclease Cas2